MSGLVATTVAVAVVVLSGCASGAVFLRPVGGRSFSALSQPSPEPIGPFEGDDEARFEALSEAWHERLRARGVPGGALAVVIDGELRFAAGVGVRRLGSDLPVTRDTRFRVASVSKMVVAATVLSLASDGLLALDDPMRSIVPDFAAPPRADADIDRVTIERLLTHTAAIPDLACTDDISLDETRRRWARAPFWGPPGAFFNYSNFGYALLASAIAVTEGDDFRAVVARRVFARAPWTPRATTPGVSSRPGTSTVASCGSVRATATRRKRRAASSPAWSTSRASPRRSSPAAARCSRPRRPMRCCRVACSWTSRRAARTATGSWRASAPASGSSSTAASRPAS